MKKHKFNIFPESSPSEYAIMRDDIKASGYDQSQPITLYQGDIIDGWNRQRACDELGIKPHYTEFIGSDSDAIAFIMRTNKRRNLNPGQWACIAAEAEEILAAIREESKERQGMRTDLTSDKKLSEVHDEHANTTATKAAEMFNTNRTYVNKAVKLKNESPEEFQKVKSGEIKMSQAAKKDRPQPEPLDSPTKEFDPLVVDESKPTRRSPVKIIEDEGMNIWLLAKSHLERINKHDTQREQALKACAEYCNNRLQSRK